MKSSHTTRTSVKSSDEILRNGNGWLHWRLYRTREHDVLTVNTASLVKSYESNTRLSPINSGATLWPSAAERGSSTFTSIADYPTDERARRSIVNAANELAVIDSVPDIRDHIVEVERRRGTDILEAIYFEPVPLTMGAGDPRIDELAARLGGPMNARAH
ncbi:hypothetical protein ABQE45_16190 [Mycobacteroides chelonae]